MNKKQIALTTLLCLSSLWTGAASTEKAKLSLDRNNIKVWTYQKTDNPVFQYKAETTFDVPLERAVAVILDVNRADQWVPYMGKVEMLSQDEKKGEFTLYMVLDFPFPLKDRDVVVKGKMSKAANGIVTIKNTAISGNYPIQPDVVRLTRYEGDWTFQKLTNNKVKVTTSGYADPAGAIPLSFVNMFVQQQPYQMLLKMKREVTSPIYEHPKLPEILK
ncbi:MULTISPECIES: START domain-containing protein [Acinetobacter calcoaceticus/baumannii complex]|uniref:START domain-containing protein n=1 Tax=Acinetobacter calcoaceticus/baumannii complex TaxID=909768 RepID=UPI00077E2E85|nr:MULTISPECIES: START domain-containing protein [Acinetobacter calcoaceticus/baumannii complex]MCG9510728.1 START domain-containing protein [Acinetobacter pittii]QXA07229.1 START domain-containing protein [Acinetobacter pittii]